MKNVRKWGCAFFVLRAAFVSSLYTHETSKPWKNDLANVETRVNMAKASLKLDDNGAAVVATLHDASVGGSS